LRDGEVAAALGALALALADEPENEAVDLARGILEIAADRDPSNARTRSALARAHALAGDREKAEARLADALGQAPGDARVQRDAGEAALASGAADEARARFERAIALDEHSAAAWYGLGCALARARSLGWSAELDLELGRLHADADRAAEARALLQPLAADPHGGRIAKQAAELLRELELPNRDLSKPPSD